MADHCLLPALLLILGLLSPGASGSETIKATTIKEPPYVSDDEGGLKGFIPDMMDKLGAKINVKFELDPVGDGRYGSKGVDGEWDGMIGEVDKGTARIAAAPITVSDERKEVLAFTEPFMKFELTLVMKKGSEAGISSVQDLTARDDLNYGAVKEGITESFFKGSSDTDYAQMWRVMQRAENRMDTISAGVERIESQGGKYAMVMESSTAEWWVGRQPCNLVQVKLGIPTEHEYALAARKEDTQLVGRLNTGLQALKKDGELERLRTKWWKDNSDCTSGVGKVAVSSGSLLLLALAALGVYWPR